MPSSSITPPNSSAVRLPEKNSAATHSSTAARYHRLRRTMKNAEGRVETSMVAVKFRYGMGGISHFAVNRSQWSA